jgi:hypothetical protein
MGEVNGDRKVDNADIASINSVFGQVGQNLDQDVNGDGVVNGLDRLLTARARGRQLGAGLLLND